MQGATLTGTNGTWTNNPTGFADQWQRCPPASKSASTVWSANAGSSVPAPDKHNVSQPLTGLASSGGLLVVSAGTGLVAFR